MKNGIKIAFVYIGLIIGAGFASGREIFEYFNLHTGLNPLPIIFAAIMFGLISYIILSKSLRLKISDFGEFVSVTAGRLAPFIKAVMYLFMFCGFFVMLSASGSLFATAFSVSRKAGTVLLALVCFTVFAFDIKGIVAINTVLVPFMICGITYLSVTSLLYGSCETSTFAATGNMFVTAVCYVSYNTITAGAVLVPLYSILNKKSIRTGVILGTAILGVLILLIWGVLNMFYDKIFCSDMPLFGIAAIRGEIYQTIYTAVLFTSICTTAVSHGFGILSQLKFNSKKSRVLASAVFCALALPFSDFNFSFLVSSLYSVFGYFGLVWLAILLIKR